MKKASDRALLNELKEIFLHVADAVDGGERVPTHLKIAYHKAMESRAVKQFYQEACDDRSFYLGMMGFFS